MKRLRGAPSEPSTRRAALTIGVVLVTAAMWLWFGDYGWETVTEGLALVLGATVSRSSWPGFRVAGRDWAE